jgi:hypothetical protein
MSELSGIRIGVPEDVHGIMEIATDMWEELGITPPSPQKILGEVWAALHQQDGIIGIIGEPGGPIEGGILLRVGSMWYSDAKVLEERGIFIHRDFRSIKGGRARRLCQFAKNAADSLGLPLLIGILSDDRTEAKARLYERQFGKPVGAFFLYGAKTGLKKET